MKSGLRQMKVAEDKKVKKHVKAFYNILETIQSIAGQLDSNIEYNEDNIHYLQELIFQLIRTTEQVGIILSKASNSR